jgi:hypothetical protein
LKTALPKYILPQFKKLLLQEALDAGEIGEVVARVVLLLAMDTCVAIQNKATNHTECQFTGQFVSVQLFLTGLSGQDPRVMKTKNKPADLVDEDDFKAWRSRWDGWQMGFVHFLQLTHEPNEATLWFLLGRRAAGVFPRGHNGADLVIPMFHEEEMSLILVQVKNREKRDSEYPASATKKMHPSFVFDEDNSLSELSSRDVIRVYVSLRERVPERNPSRYFLVEQGGADETSASSKKAKTTSGETKRERRRARRHSDPKGLSTNAYTFCIMSVNTRSEPWKLVDGGLALPIVTEAVAAHLVDLMSTRWDPIGLVNSDLLNRQAMETKLLETSIRRRLSPAMPDNLWREIAAQALLRSPGHIPPLSGRK